MNVKKATNYFLAALLTLVGYYIVSAGVVGYQAYTLKSEVKTLFDQIRIGDTVNYENQITKKIDSEIIGLNSTLTNPFWRPLTNHFLKDSQKEIVLALQLVKVAPSVMGPKGALDRAAWTDVTTTLKTTNLATPPKLEEPPNCGYCLAQKLSPIRKPWPVTKFDAS